MLVEYKTRLDNLIKAMAKVKDKHGKQMSKTELETFLKYKQGLNQVDKKYKAYFDQYDIANLTYDEVHNRLCNEENITAKQIQHLYGSENGATADLNAVIAEPEPTPAGDPNKTPTDNRPLCRDYQRGNCNRGNNCKFKHKRKRNLISKVQRSR